MSLIPSVHPRTTLDWCFDQHLIDILVDMRPTLYEHLNQHLIDNNMIVSRVSTTSGLSIDLRWHVYRKLVNSPTTVDLLWAEHQPRCRFMGIQCRSRLDSATDAFGTHDPLVLGTCHLMEGGILHSLVYCCLLFVMPHHSYPGWRHKHH